MRVLNITWPSLKVAKARSEFLLYYVAGDTASNSYDLFGLEGDRFYSTSVKGTNDGDSGKDFVTNFKDAAIETVSMDDAITLTAPKINTLGAQLVEVTSSTYQQRSVTIVTHDFSEPCTWWQNSIKVTQEVLTDAGSDVFTSVHALWINIEHPKLFTDELLDFSAWAGAGYPGYPIPTTPYYFAWWQADATLKKRDFYYPVVEVQPGGTGDWQVADPASTSSAPNYAYTIDYTLGKVHFNDTTGWAVDTKARATYYYVVESNAASMFEIGPPADKLWQLVRTEVQLSVGSSWQDTVLFYGKQQGIAGSRAQYKTYGNMQSTATSAGAVVLEGAQGTAQSWPASAENGWSFGGFSGARGTTKNMEVNPWVYEKPFELKGNLSNRICVCLADGKKFLETDIANVTFYINEYLL